MLVLLLVLIVVFNDCFSFFFILGDEYYVVFGVFFGVVVGGIYFSKSIFLFFNDYVIDVVYFGGLLSRGLGDIVGRGNVFFVFVFGLVVILVLFRFFVVVNVKGVGVVLKKVCYFLFWGVFVDVKELGGLYVVCG